MARSWRQFGKRHALQRDDTARHAPDHLAPGAAVELCPERELPGRHDGGSTASDVENTMATSISDDDEQNDDDQDLGPDDAIELLSDDPIEVQQLFLDYDSLVDDMANAAERESLAREICALLTAHTQIEEEIFYQAAQQILNGEDLIDLTLAEHAQAKQLMAEIEAASANEAR